MRDVVEESFSGQMMLSDWKTLSTDGVWLGDLEQLGNEKQVLFNYGKSQNVLWLKEYQCLLDRH